MSIITFNSRAVKPTARLRRPAARALPRLSALRSCPPTSSFLAPPTVLAVQDGMIYREVGDHVWKSLESAGEFPKLNEKISVCDMKDWAFISSRIGISPASDSVIDTPASLGAYHGRNGLPPRIPAEYSAEEIDIYSDSWSAANAARILGEDDEDPDDEDDMTVADDPMPTWAYAFIPTPAEEAEAAELLADLGADEEIDLGLTFHGCEENIIRDGDIYALGCVS